MSSKKTTLCLAKLNLHMSLIGSRLKWRRTVWNSGWMEKKPVLLLRMSVGNAGLVNFHQTAQQAQKSPVVHQTPERSLQITQSPVNQHQIEN
ncbi:hypothetical protein M5689_021961 [Euphorbia peplus]|nr:hypothetical protein M5689_021961 [Euphorbia peplus]